MSAHQIESSAFIYDYFTLFAVYIHTRARERIECAVHLQQSCIFTGWFGDRERACVCATALIPCSGQSEPTNELADHIKQEITSRMSICQYY